MKKVLIFPGGTEIGLEIFKSLSYNKDIELYSVSDNLPNPSSFFFQRNTIIPSINEKGWLEALNDVLIKNRIDYIYPAHDYVHMELLKNRDKINAKIVSVPLETCQITRSKSKTYEFFKDLIPVPFLCKTISNIIEFPVFLKPDKGSGSEDIFLVENKKELDLIMEKKKDMIILEYLPGKEYTVDCFTDREKGLLFCQGRERLRIKSGISVNSKIVKNDIFKKYAEIISKKLKLYGAWFFQLKADKKGLLKLLEIGHRIAGTMALNRVLGVNFPLLSIYELERIDIEILKNDFECEIYRTFKNRYKTNLEYSTIYIDLDDTLIVKNKVNPHIISFLYQCVNLDKKLILISKHRENVKDTLKKHKICESLFDKIIILKETDLKKDFITSKDAIFIDDSFNERKIVANHCKIPTFDTNMIECLIDERD